MSDSYHFIGIGGIGMSGLARILLSQKIPVTGSDIALNQTVEHLIKEGAIVHKGHAAENIPPRAHVVFTSDVKEDNPEYQQALKLKLPLLHRSDLLAVLLKDHQALAVAGTHGKTTTSALLSTVLFEAGFDPSFAVGGVLPAFQSNARFGKGELFPFEADESDRSFLKYHPFGAIVTNIDNDHLNNYEGSFSLLVDSFKIFMQQVESPRHLFWCREDTHLTQLNMPGQTYGFHSSSDWKIVSHRQEGFKMVFDLEHQGHLYSQIELGLIGRHNVLNATAVFGLAITLGASEEKIRHALKTFQGVLRRCEEKGVCQGVRFLDDYAHHPSEIQTTLQGMRQAIGPSRLIAVFQPHRYTRTQDCLGQYGTVFDDADELLITDIFGAGEAPMPHLSHALIVQEIQEKSTIPCRYVPRSALSHFLSEFVRPFDTVATLGAGDITKLGSETLTLLEKKSLKPITVGCISSVDAFHAAYGQLSPQGLKFVQFLLTDGGQWLLGNEPEPARSSHSYEKCSQVILEELRACDVVMPLTDEQAGSLQGFLEIMGIPYIGSGPREIWLSREIDALRRSLAEMGIRALSPHLSLAEGSPKGDYFDFLVRESQGASCLSSSHDLSSMAKQSKAQLLTASLLTQGNEFSKRIYQALECTRTLLIRVLLDSQQRFWFDRIVPISGEGLILFLQNEQIDGISLQQNILDLILYALQTNRFSQRQKKNV